MKKNNVFMLVLLVVLSVVLAACGTSEEKSSGSDGEKGYSKLLVGTEATFTPFSIDMICAKTFQQL